jgi:hypothetical protein
LSAFGKILLDFRQNPADTPFHTLPFGGGGGEMAQKQPNPWPPEGGVRRPPAPPPRPPRKTDPGHEQTSSNAERVARRVWAEQLIDALIDAAIEKPHRNSADLMSSLGAGFRYDDARNRAIKLLLDGEVLP